MSRADALRQQLGALACRYAGLGIGPDLAALTLAGAWGLFVFLRRLAGGGDVG